MLISFLLLAGYKLQDDLFSYLQVLTTSKIFNYVFICVVALSLCALPFYVGRMGHDTS
jgi:hypothetical protein